MIGFYYFSIETFLSGLFICGKWLNDKNSDSWDLEFKYLSWKVGNIFITSGHYKAIYMTNLWLCISVIFLCGVVIEVKNHLRKQKLHVCVDVFLKMRTEK